MIIQKRENVEWNEWTVVNPGTREVVSYIYESENLGKFGYWGYGTTFPLLFKYNNNGWYDTFEEVFAAAVKDFRERQRVLDHYTIKHLKIG